jgi:hypothetical protein
MKKICINISALVILLSNCTTINNDENINKIQIKDLYEFKLPGFLNENNEDSNESVKVFSNSFREVHVLIKHTKKDLYDPADTISLEKTAKSMLILLFLSENEDLQFDRERQDNFKALTINGLKAVQTNVTGVSLGAKINILYTLIEGYNYFYTIQAWTHLDEKDQYKNDFNKMINSFKEIKMNDQNI